MWGGNLEIVVGDYFRGQQQYINTFPVFHVDQWFCALLQLNTIEGGRGEPEPPRLDHAVRSWKARTSAMLSSAVLRTSHLPSAELSSALVLLNYLYRPHKKNYTCHIVS